MPGLAQDSDSRFQSFTVKELHPTFAAEITGLDLSKDVSDETFNEILRAMAKYGVCVFRDTKLDDTSHVNFSRRFGDLDDIRPYVKGNRKLRYPYYELFDAGNIDEDGGVLGLDSPRAHYGKGNGLWHVDSSFNPRRASYSILLAHVLPPPSTGGNTDFADSRTAFETLPADLQSHLLEANYLGAHSLHHSRKTGSPTFFHDLDPLAHPMHRHRIVQHHAPSDRMTLYIGAHMHHIEGFDATEDVNANTHSNSHTISDSHTLTNRLMQWATRPENTVSIPWTNVGDMIIWDNRVVMHRAAGGTYEGKFKRDLRRTTVHDSSDTAWGVNDQTVDSRPGFDVAGVGTGKGMENGKGNDGVVT